MVSLCPLQELPGAVINGRVHHFTVNLDSGASGWQSFAFECFDDCAGLLEFGCGWGEGAVYDGNLGRVDAELAVVAEGAGKGSFGLEAGMAAEIGFRRVNGEDAGSMTGDDETGAGPGDLDAAGGALGAQIGGQVFASQEGGSYPGRGGQDALCGKDAGGGFDEGQNRDVSGRDIVFPLEYGEVVIDALDEGWGVSLWEDDAVESGSDD